MILNLRYHIFTLMAIFLALGAGLLIGSTIVVKDSLLEEQQRLIRQLEKDFLDLRGANRELLSQNEKIARELLNERELLLSVFLEGVLKELRISIKNQEGVDLKKTQLPYLLSLTKARLVDASEEFDVLLIIGEEKEEGAYNIPEEDFSLPSLLKVIKELYDDQRYYGNHSSL